MPKPPHILTTRHVGNPSVGDTLTLGTKTFTFVHRPRIKKPGDVEIVRRRGKLDKAATLANLIAAVNASGREAKRQKGKLVVSPAPQSGSAGKAQLAGRIKRTGTIADVLPMANDTPEAFADAVTRGRGLADIGRELAATRAVAIRGILSLTKALGLKPTERPARILAGLVRAEMRKGGK